MDRIEMLKALKGIKGLEVVPMFDKLEVGMPKCEFPVDGYVIKSEGSQPWAYKPTGDQKVSKVIGITWQLGNTGKLTPVLHIEPTKIEGAWIENVTGNSIRMMEEFKCGIGSSILVERSGMVIPRLVETVETSEDYNLPSGDDIYREGAHLFKKVEIKVYDRLFEMLSLKKGLGGALKDKIRKYCSLDCMDDVNYLFENSLGNVVFTKYEIGLVKEAVAQLKSLNYVEFLEALSLPNIGSSAVKKIINGEVLPSHSKKSWEAYAEEVAEVVEILKPYGWNLSEVEEVQEEVQEGLKVCMTGKHEMKRSEMESILKEKGYQVVGSVNKETDILLIADINSTSSKAKKAKELGVKMVGNISEL